MNFFNSIASIFQEHLTLIQVSLFAGLISILWFAEVIISATPWRKKLNHSSVNFKKSIKIEVGEEIIMFNHSFIQIMVVIIGMIINQQV